jgi:hypothetical protein
MPYNLLFEENAGAMHLSASLWILCTGQPDTYILLLRNAAFICFGNAVMGSALNAKSLFDKICYSNVFLFILRDFITFRCQNTWLRVQLQEQSPQGCNESIIMFTKFYKLTSLFYLSTSRSMRYSSGVWFFSSCTVIKTIKRNDAQIKKVKYLTFTIFLDVMLLW